MCGNGLAAGKMPKWFPVIAHGLQATSNSLGTEWHFIQHKATKNKTFHSSRPSRQ